MQELTHSSDRKAGSLRHNNPIDRKQTYMFSPAIAAGTFYPANNTVLSQALNCLEEAAAICYEKIAAQQVTCTQMLSIHFGNIGR